MTSVYGATTLSVTTLRMIGIAATLNINDTQHYVMLSCFYFIFIATLAVVMLCVIMLSVIMLSVIMLSVVIVSVSMLSVVILRVVKLSVILSLLC